MTPVYAAIWASARLVTLPLPAWLFEHVDLLLWREYQNFNRLFFELAAGVSVRLLLFIQRKSKGKGRE